MTRFFIENIRVPKKRYATDFLEDHAGLAHLAHPYCTKIRTVVLYHKDIGWAPVVCIAGRRPIRGKMCICLNSTATMRKRGGNPLTRRPVECARPIAPCSGVEHAGPG